MQYGRGDYEGADPYWYTPARRRLGSSHDEEKQVKRDLQQEGQDVGDSEFDVEFEVAQGVQPNYLYDNMVVTVTEASGTTGGLITLAMLCLLWVVSCVLLIAQLAQFMGGNDDNLANDDDDDDDANLALMRDGRDEKMSRLKTKEKARSRRAVV